METTTLPTPQPFNIAPKKWNAVGYKKFMSDPLNVATMESFTFEDMLVFYSNDEQQNAQMFARRRAELGPQVKAAAERGLYVRSLTGLQFARPAAAVDGRLRLR